MKPENITPDKMREIRKKHGFSQQRLADEFEASKRNITYKETGELPISRLLAYAMIGLDYVCGKKRK